MIWLKSEERRAARLCNGARPAAVTPRCMVVAQAARESARPPASRSAGAESQIVAKVRKRQTLQTVWCPGEEQNPCFRVFERVSLPLNYQCVKRRPCLHMSHSVAYNLIPVVG